MTNHIVDPNKKVEQAEAFVLEQAGYTKMTHRGECHRWKYCATFLPYYNPHFI